MTNRMVLARLGTIEQGFKNILSEVKGGRIVGCRGTSAGEEPSTRRRVARKVERRDGEWCGRA